MVFRDVTVELLVLKNVPLLVSLKIEILLV